MSDDVLFLFSRRPSIAARPCLGRRATSAASACVNQCLRHRRRTGCKAVEKASGGRCFWLWIFQRKNRRASRGGGLGRPTPFQPRPLPQHTSHQHDCQPGASQQQARLAADWRGAFFFSRPPKHASLGQVRPGAPSRPTRTARARGKARLVHSPCRGRKRGRERWGGDEKKSFFAVETAKHPLSLFFFFCGQRFREPLQRAPGRPLFLHTHACIAQPRSVRGTGAF